MAPVGAPVGLDGSGGFSVVAELGAWRWKSPLFCPSINHDNHSPRDHTRKIEPSDSMKVRDALRLMTRCAIRGNTMGTICE